MSRLWGVILAVGTVAVAVIVVVVGPVMSATAEPVCVDDASGDTTAEINPDAEPPQRTSSPKADITRVCVDRGDGLTLSMALADANDPTTDVSWQDPTTYAAWGLDTDGDASLDSTVTFGTGPDGTLAAAVSDPDGTARCRAEAGVEADTYRVTGIPLDCLNGNMPTGLNASVAYDLDPADPLAPNVVDVAPDDGALTSVGSSRPSQGDSGVAGPDPHPDTTGDDRGDGQVGRQPDAGGQPDDRTGGDSPRLGRNDASLPATGFAAGVTAVALLALGVGLFQARRRQPSE